MSFVFEEAPTEVLARYWNWDFPLHVKARLVVAGHVPDSALVTLDDLDPAALTGPGMGLTGQRPTGGKGWANSVTFYDVGDVAVGGVLVYVAPPDSWLIYYGEFAPLTPGSRPLTVSWPSSIFRI